MKKGMGDEQSGNGSTALKTLGSRRQGEKGVQERRSITKDRGERETARELLFLGGFLG